MPFSVMITPECENQAKVYNQYSALMKLKENIERYQNLAGFDRLSSSNFFKRPLSNNYRLISFLTKVGDRSLVTFLRVLKRGDSEYPSLIESIVRGSDDLLRRHFRITHEDIRKMFEEVKVEQKVEELLKPTNEERRWLYEVFFEDSKAMFRDEIMVLESNDWIKEIKSEKYQEHIKDFHRLLEENLDRFEPSIDTKDIKVLSKKDKYGIYKIYYLYFADQKRLNLLRPLAAESEVDDLSVFEKLSKESALHNKFYRAYPLLILLDFNLWKEIQRDEEANLALSPEESELLDSLSEWGENFTGYPLFINGRAGSGKSTMLQYLTAEYIYFALRNNLTGRILYMTYSKELLDRARSVVKSLINLNYRRIINEKIPEERVEECLSQTFAVFNNFLYSLLDDEDRSKLSPEKYIDYPRFKKLWEEQFSRRNESRGISVEIAWHTIRTYIKGMRTNYDDDFGVEEYEELPKKRKTVSKRVFNEIFEKVWNGWYKRLCTEQGYWDDQDLATLVFEKGLANSVNAVAIFCDEAQDFTSVELRVILQMSLFSKRQLTADELRRVPIVFAGDPLQTINPTGFSWEATKDEFHKVFSEILDPHGTMKLSINFKDLSYNYRSNPGIVKFCNTIQLLRQNFLGNKDIKPQQSWWEEEPVVVGVFNDEYQIIEGLKNRPEMVILVNCEAGEEYEYVNNDPVLKVLKKDRELERVYQNVLSPMRAKGLEFQGVVLYRFIESFKDYKDRLISGSIDLENIEERLPFEYFFNRLYVAASRAKKDLCIVDSKEAVDNFWLYYFNNLDQILSKIKNKEEWEGKISSILTSDNRWWDRERISLEELAAEYELEGIKKQDPYLLRQAALNYMQTSNKNKTLSCKAMAYYFEGDYSKAGESFLELGDLERAFESFWRARVWSKVVEIAKQQQSLQSRRELLAAKIITTADEKLDLEEVNRILDFFDEQSFLLNALKDSSWIEFLNNFSDKLIASKLKHKINWYKVYSLYKQFVERGVNFKPRSMAIFAFEAGDLDTSIRYWELANDRESYQYKVAKAKTTTFPENIYWYGLLKEYDEIVKIWNQNKGKVNNAEIEDGAMNYLLKALIEKRDLSSALDLLLVRPKVDFLREILSLGIERENQQLILRTLMASIRFFLKSHELNNFRRTIDLLEIPFLPEKEVKRISEKLAKLVNYSALFRFAVQEVSSINRDDLKTFLERLIEKDDLRTAAFMLRFFTDKGILKKLWKIMLDRVDGKLLEELLIVNIVYLVNDRKWNEILNFLNNNIYELIPDDFETPDRKLIVRVDRARLFNFCFFYLATTKILDEEKKNIKEDFNNLIKMELLDIDNVVYEKMPIKLITAVVDKVFPFNEKASLYRRILRNIKNREEIRYFNSLLSKSYLELAKYHREREDFQKATDYENRAKLIMSDFSITEKELEMIPYLTLNDIKWEDVASTSKRLRVVEKTTKKVQPLRDRFQFRFSRKHNKLRIENSIDFQTCLIDLSFNEPEKLLKGDVKGQLIECIDNRKIKFHVPEWNVNIILDRQEKLCKVTIEDNLGDKIQKKFEIGD